MALHAADFARATFAGVARRGPCEWERVVIAPVMVRDEFHWQFSYYDDRKHITKNLRPAEADAALDELLDFGFAGIHVTRAGEELDFRTSKRGKIFGSRRQLAPTALSDTAMSHNRVKALPMPDGEPNRLLIAMGIQSPDGRVRASLRDKFTQINEFLKQLRFAVNEAGLTKRDRPLQILDCGCGSSYLTLAAHFDLNENLGIPAQVVGLDINDEVIRKSITRAEVLGTDGLTFNSSPIGRADQRADVVLALHACDTATDDAIVQAIRSEAAVFLGAPCCHRHLNQQLRASGAAEVLAPVLRHGILLQRTADQLTDALRALMLRVLGYRTDVFEFVETQHTPRNLMIRAIRARTANVTESLREYRELCRFWNVVPYLEMALGDRWPKWNDERGSELSNGTR
jgi:2-polyprenyl-3-methyl-5-hydroxy-6-metoxy-1,4-benzoquinol methylase